MTKIVKKKKQKKATLEDLIKALDLDKKNAKCDSHAYGKVEDIDRNDGSYYVSLNGSQTTVKCARLVGAAVGDTVFVTILKNGFAVVTDCLGGDKDALKTAEHFWTNAEGAHVTQIPQEDFEDDPENGGGNVLIKSIGMLIRDGLTNLLQVLQTGIIIGNEQYLHLSIQNSKIAFMQGSNDIIRIEWESIGDHADMSRESEDNAAWYQHDVQFWPKRLDIESFRYPKDYSTETGAIIRLEADGNGSTIDLISDKLEVSGQPLFKTFTATGTVSINSNTGGNVTVTGTKPAGYTPIAVSEITSDHDYTCLIGKFVLVSNGANISLRNMSSSNYNNMTVTATILCVREECG